MKIKTFETLFEAENYRRDWSDNHNDYRPFDLTILPIRDNVFAIVRISCAINIHTNIPVIYWLREDNRIM